MTLGDNLGTYLAGGGIVVAFNFDWFGGSQSILGTWSTTYTPFNDQATVNFTNGTLGTCTFSPLCNGVTALNAFFRETVTLASGATQAATWNDGSILMAYKGRAVGISAYVGDFSDNWSGDYARIIANAGRYLSPQQCGTITLSAHGRSVQGRQTVDLSWDGAASANIDIYRDGVKIATVPNSGTYKDFIGVRGGNARYTYKVCEAGTSNCSNQVTVRFGGPPL